MAVVIQLVVGELQLVKGDHLLHPLGTLGQKIQRNGLVEYDETKIYPLGTLGTKLVMVDRSN